MSAFDRRSLVLALLAVAIFAVLGGMRPDVFLSAANLESMLLQSSIVGILSLAVALSMLTGGIDLSVNATANLAAIVASLVLNAMVLDGGAEGQVGAVLVASLVAVALGTLAGVLNGLLVAYAGCTPILVTLGTMTLFAGIGTLLTGGDTFFGLPLLTEIGRGSLLAVPIPALVFLGLAVFLTLLLGRSVFGRQVLFLGANPKAARFAGVGSRRLLLKVYAGSGALSAVAGLLSLAISNSANVDFGGSYVLLAILIVVLGGINPAGGAGKIVGVVLAVLILQFLSTGLNLVYQSGDSIFLKEFAWGAALLLVLAFSRPGVRHLGLRHPGVRRLLRRPQSGAG